MLPAYIDVFLSVIRDNAIAQSATVGVLVLILCDWVFGIANAVMHKRFSSQIMREGLGHKCAELGLLLVALVADGLLLGGLDIGINGPVYCTIAVYLCIMELGSLLEIFADMNPDLGSNPIFKVLASVKDDAQPAHAQHAAGDAE